MTDFEEGTVKYSKKKVAEALDLVEGEDWRVNVTDHEYAYRQVNVHILASGWKKIAEEVGEQ